MKANAAALLTKLCLFCPQNEVPLASLMTSLFTYSSFEPGSGHVGFMVDKVALGQVFSNYFGFPCQSSFHQLLHNQHHHLGLVQ
jgi:hypothetical protein